MQKAGKAIQKSANRLLDIFFNWLSYISMATYLFHSQVYEILFKVIGRFSIWEACFLVLPLTLAIFGIIQLGYDRVTDNLKNKSKLVKDNHCIHKEEG